MRSFRHIALVTTLLTPVVAMANSQCVSLPDSAPPAAPPAPAVQPAAAPVTPPAREASPGSSAADKIKAAGAHEMSAEEIAKIPGLKPIAEAGARIFVIGDSAGVPNMIAVNQEHFQAFTPLADPHYLCRGVVQDDQGNNVTLDEAKKLPGLVPSTDHAQVQPIASPAEAIDAAAHASFGTFGPANAPKVWAVVDPLCVHSQQTIRDLLPYAKDGKIQLNIVPVSVIDPRSAPAARVLLSEQPDKMLQRWMPSQFDDQTKQPDLLHAQYDVGSAQKLMGNLRLFAGMSTGMHVAGVPEILWTSGGQAHAKAGLDTAEVPSFISGLGS